MTWSVRLGRLPSLFHAYELNRKGGRGGEDQLMSELATVTQHGPFSGFNRVGFYHQKAGEFPRVIRVAVPASADESAAQDTFFT